ncbi:rod shape-determining protein MreD [Paracoccus sp. (in: a-proteobacteria)]|uniref:rod shape-determining protein MreD n=1 Tax=Paracoccus sp. TaxID=267 RepID=UPI0026DEC5C3|nr:rod shape-determining protein MreD [Paracoccus sp. (in: a-proteobacteria)]MDO5646940.1 rod shape-determining protein MreD [Paracoccus sp. (in: a-proteobacteria)]
MNGTPTRTVLIGSALFLACYGVILFLRLLPLSGGPVIWPGPDTGLALIFAWVLRRPDQLPAAVIVLAVVIEDILLLRPLGIWALFTLLAAESARLREHRWRDQSFMIEWLRVAILMAGMVVGYRVVLFVFMVPLPALGPVLLNYLATVAAYPVVVFVARWLIGLRRASQAESGW